MNRVRLQWALLFVSGTLFGGVVGCSYHNDHGGYHGGHHDREDVYVHDHDHYRHY